MSVSLDGRPVDRDGSNGLDVRANVVSDGYLDALGIPMLRGRDFTRADGAASPRVAIVSRSLAARLWPNQDPIDKILIDGNAPATVIGMVPDTVYRNALEREPPPFFYVPLAQNYESGVALHVRAAQGIPLRCFLRSARRSAPSIPELSWPGRRGSATCSINRLRRSG